MSNPVENSVRLALQEKPANQVRVMTQHWLHLLFLHWEYDAEQIQSRLPPGLKVDTYQGKAYMGIVPFVMKGIRPRFMPAVPWFSTLLELNLRTYVYDQKGTPGVWFFSLDANKLPAVWLARNFFHLNYLSAKQTFQAKNKTYTFTSKRKGSRHQEASKFIFRPHEHLFEADQNSFTAFLTNRFILFSYDSKKKRLFQGRVYHPPYPLRKAELLLYDQHLFQLDGFTAPLRAPDHTIMSPGVKVDIYGLEKNEI